MKSNSSSVSGLSDELGKDVASVAFVILTKNSERTMAECLKALTELDRLRVRVVVVDGASTDRTLDIVESFKNSLDLITVSDEGKGLGYARDVGWRSAGSPYIVMLDSDVVMGRDFVPQAIKLLESDDSLGAVSAKLRPVIYGKGWSAVFQAKNLAIHLHLGEPTYPAEAVALHTACTMFKRRPWRRWEASTTFSGWRRRTATSASG
ncbi:MAG: glycosyltransferase family A protein [Candidatus Caldarchaeum sp.]|nr:glycosyltransferase family A protein [Candidatus Caldarchaeum sp.]